MAIKESWVFADWGIPRLSDISMAAELGFTDIVFGVVDGVVYKDGKATYGIYEPYKSSYGYENVFLHAKNLGMNTHAMAFIYRKRKYLGDCLNMLEYAARLKPHSVLLNIEGPGLRGNAVSKEEYLNFIDRLFFGLYGLGVALGSVVIPPYPKLLYPMLGYFDYVILEAYSFWSKNNTRLWSHTDKMFPGQFQKKVIADFGKCSEEIFGSTPKEYIRNKLIVGLANYELDRPATMVRPAVSQKENVRLCIEAVDSADIPSIAVWSLKNFRGNSAQRKEIRELFRSVNKTIER